MEPELNASVTNGISWPWFMVPTASANSTVGAVFGRTCATATSARVVTTHPHQEIGEGQVGQQLPLADHRVQMVDRVAWQDGVLGE